MDKNISKDAKSVGSMEPQQTWTIITALDHVLSKAKGSKLCDAFWKACVSPLDYLEKELDLTRQQIVFLSIMAEAGEPISWRGFGKYLGCSRISVMTYSEEIDALIAKGWVCKKYVFESGRRYQGFIFERGVVTALRHNKPFAPKRIDGLDIQQFIDCLESHLNTYFSDGCDDLEDEEAWLQRLCEANAHLPLCHELLRFDDIHIRTLLLFIIFDYAQWAESDDEGLTCETIDETFPADFEINYMRKHLNDGTHPLIISGMVELKCEDGIANHNRYMLTRRFKEELLTGYVPSRSKCPPAGAVKRFLKSHTAIKEKPLFFNADDDNEIERLVSLLGKENLPAIQSRLEQAGMRKGIACLFYGAPGTGKTETVLQIARRTGRDIMQVDIAGMRDKYVGESEKNIKAVFQRYRDVCRQCEVLPILFFNEADALINKRTENISHSVDKMDNAMQNIILQELEDLDGILIATTNLTSNLDKAFERRFLFKVEFHKPDMDVKAKIWSSMIGDITEEDALQLARNYDFSGGQIENVARKHTIDHILMGAPVSLADIERYCQAEEFNHKSRQRIGFC